jgi:hypothetical protein
MEHEVSQRNLEHYNNYNLQVVGRGCEYQHNMHMQAIDSAASVAVRNCHNHRCCQEQSAALYYSS